MSKSTGVERPESAETRPTGLKRVLAIAGFPLFIATIVGLVFAFREPLWGLLENREALREWILAQGSWSILAFIGVQIIQVVAFVIPGDIAQFAGGYLFGTWFGTLWSLIGIGIGSGINYLLGRAMGRPFLVAAFKREWVEKIESLASKGKVEAAMFLLFAIPGLPKDLLSYLAGMTGMGFWSFLLISMLGRLPALTMSSFVGQAAQSADYATVVSIMAVAATVFFFALFNREKLFAWIEKLLHGKNPGPR